MLILQSNSYRGKRLTIEKISEAKAIERGRLLGIRRSTIVFCRFLEHYITKGRSGVTHDGAIWLYNSQEELRELLGYNRANICRLLKDAREKHLIKIGRCRSGGRGCVNYYTLNLEEYKLQINPKLDIEAFRAKMENNATKNSLRAPSSFYVVYDGYQYVNGETEEENDVTAPFASDEKTRVIEIIEEHKELKKKEMKERGVISLTEAFRRIALNNIRKQQEEERNEVVYDGYQYEVDESQTITEEYEEITEGTTEEITEEERNRLCCRPIEKESEPQSGQTEEAEQCNEPREETEVGADLVKKLINCMHVNESKTLETPINRLKEEVKKKMLTESAVKKSSLKKEDDKRAELTEEEVRDIRNDYLNKFKNFFGTDSGACTTIVKRAQKTEEKEAPKEGAKNLCIYKERVHIRTEETEDTNDKEDKINFINIKKPGRNSKPEETEEHLKEKQNKKKKVTESEETTTKTGSVEENNGRETVKSEEVVKWSKEIKKIKKTEGIKNEGEGKLKEESNPVRSNPASEKEGGESTKEEQTVSSVKEKLKRILCMYNCAWCLKYSEDIKIQANKTQLKMQFLRRGFIYERLQTVLPALKEEGVIIEDKTEKDCYLYWREWKE